MFGKEKLSECPYCGKPIIETCMGYPVKDLIKLAKCLMIRKISPEELDIFIFNLDWALETVMISIKEKLTEDLKCHAKVTIKAADNNNTEGERKNDKL